MTANKKKEQRDTKSLSKGLILLTTGQQVIDLGEFKTSKSAHSYREVLVPYTETELRCRKNLDKKYHHLIIRSEKLGSPKKS